MSTEPADKKDTCIYRSGHYGRHEHHISFRLDKHVVDIKGSFLELGILVVFPYISLNDSDG